MLKNCKLSLGLKSYVADTSGRKLRSWIMDDSAPLSRHTLKIALLDPI